MPRLCAAESTFNLNNKVGNKAGGGKVVGNLNIFKSQDGQDL